MTAVEKLIRQYGGRWEIERASVEVWTAVRKSLAGRHAVSYGMTSADSTRT